ncbi:T9SS type A sorting domain-containing protein [Hymenobacter sp. BT662]|uniref:T9SS type A sorting domain-containing protein n=1 Tax=Hymenobacter ruricola TaxID=2791023 RepID=A0ABS0I4D3_9BACT|nr:T9SS type A sorting domain-containing protein [Hymenobacter ruricola]
MVPNSEWQSRATVLAPTSGYAVATTLASPNWPAERTDLAFYRYGNPLALPRLSRIQDLDGGSNDYSTDILAAPNGYFISAQVGNRAIRKLFRLLRTDTAGAILWQRNYGVGVNDFITGMRYTADGNLVLAGQSSAGPNNDLRLRLLLVNQQGDSLAGLQYAYPPSAPTGNVRANGAFEDRLLALRNGHFALLAEFDTTGATYSMLLNVDRRLQPRWQYIFRAPPLFGVSRRMFFAGACELRDSSVLVLATNQNSSGHNNPFYLLRLDGATGQLRNTYPLLSNLCAQFHATKMLPDGDSALFVLGTCVGGTGGGTYAAHISLRGLPGVVPPPAVLAQRPALRPQLETLYPNPADASATLTYRCPPGLTGAGTLRVRDVLGREVQRLPVPARPTGMLPLPLATLASGLYLCELSWPGQPPATRKLLVRH